MQYKIPIQIENEDIIFFGLSLRQIGIIMAWGGVAYTIFKQVETKLNNQELALILSIPILILGIAIAVVRISEMTFLPLLLNFIRLSLNNKARPWSQGTDSFDELSIGYVSSVTEKVQKENKSFSEAIKGKDEFSEIIKNL